MAVITKSFKFEAAHQLYGHKGKCARLHGHSYVVQVSLVGSIKPCPIPDGAKTSWDAYWNYPPNTIESDSGMVTDYDDLSQIMKPLIENYLDHKFLNELPGLPRSTAELLACWIYGVLYQRFAHGVLQVTVCETDNTTAQVNEWDWISTGKLGRGTSLNSFLPLNDQNGPEVKADTEIAV